jgi:hypothetical protein
VAESSQLTPETAGVLDILDRPKQQSTSGCPKTGYSGQELAMAEPCTHPNSASFGIAVAEKIPDFARINQ